MKNHRLLLIGLFCMCNLIAKGQKCGSPLDSISFKNFKTQLSKHDFDEAKMKEMDQAFGKKCFSSEQIKSLLNVLSFEEDKIKIAKKAYANVSDPANYLLILSAFNFEASKTEIKQFIEPKK